MFDCLRFDPDILVGYEVQMRSWGYLLQRAAVLGVDLCQLLSRVPGMPIWNHGNMEERNYAQCAVCATKEALLHVLR